MDVMQINIKESVRNLVEFCMKSGDLDNRFSTNARAVEGTRAHQRLQKNNSEIYSDYESEVYLSYDFKINNVLLSIEGRADGIIREDKKVIIEEIKSTYKKYAYIDDLNELHWAQAKIYGFIYCQQNNLEQITIKLSYIQLDNDEVKSFERTFSNNDLKEFAMKIVNEYVEFALLIYKRKKKRNESARTVTFPFDNYREGQRRLVETVYNTIKHKEILFAQAPTGIGKTISTIFPAVKALGQGLGDRIVYVTSKVINRQVANEAINKLREKGLDFLSITLMAKEKSCCNSIFDCNPEVCRYAHKYYEKAKAPIKEIILNENNILKDVIEKYSQKYEVCPFELSLDVCMYCDVIIGDYNYIFSPRTAIGRLIESEGNIILVDEAHNVVDRAREIYSSTLEKDAILKCRKITKGKVSRVSSVLNKINSYFIDLRNECVHKEEEDFYEKEQPKDLIKLLRIFLKESEELLAKGNKFEGYEEILQLYFDVYSFVNISELYDENYVTIIKKDSNNIILNMFCVDPAKNLREYISKGYSTIFFSATLSPINYYIKMLGGNEHTYRVRLKSPFKKDNLKVYLSPINIRYNYRRKTINEVIRKINHFVKEQGGNYIVFCPSYAYLNMIVENINNFDFPCYDIKYQEPTMTDEEKNILLNEFKEKRNLILFCVLGGMFGEGIDLPGEQLIGCAIIGVGYPKICIENEVIKDFYKDKGYDYAYIYPGINKVQQGAGRVIRSENDKGRILLIDERFAAPNYNTLLPLEWYPITSYQR